MDKASATQIKALRILAGDQSAWNLPGKLSQRTNGSLVTRGWADRGADNVITINDKGRQAAGI